VSLPLLLAGFRRKRPAEAGKAAKAGTRLDFRTDYAALPKGRAACSF
jgi:hypothetical protein